ncbi:MAG: DUF2997 domain-containing protein [Acidobacteria bacterium]|nr:DUF2997 domain-containing protein [Acidobacteriota bacterium]
MSHTAQTKVEYRDKGALGKAILGMGGKVLGEGQYRLFGGPETGFGFTLSGWRYPLVLTSDGTLKFDDYEGEWGNRADLDRLKIEYAAAVVESKCAELCWSTQRESNGSITIYHPGGTIVVTPDGTVDAIGFQGRGCEAAVDAIAAALGEETARYCKPEANIVRNEAKQVL